MTAYLNGEFLPLEQCRISPLDRGFLFGDGVYEVMPIRNGKVFLLQQHLARLSYSLEQLDIANPHTPEQWQSLLEQLIAMETESSLGVYLQITRGLATSRNHVSPEDTTPTVFMMLMGEVYDSGLVASEGVSAITVEDIRWRRCDIKSTNLLANVMMRKQAGREGALEAIILREGQLLEGAASNVFVIKDSSIATPELGHHILSGVTRDAVLNLAKKEGIACCERTITEEELLGADEVWLSSSTKNILPVIEINKTPVGDGIPGPLWEKLSAHLCSFAQAS